MNINHLLLFLFFLMFIFIITYDPKKGTLHNGFVPGNGRGGVAPNGLVASQPGISRERLGPDYDDLRYGAPTRLMTDFMGAIFHY